MKKIFSLLCAMMLVMSASATSVHKLNKLQVEPVKALKVARHNQATIKHAPAQTESAFAATITVSNISSYGATVNISPANKSVTYYWDVFDEEEAYYADQGYLAYYGIYSLEDYIMYFYEAGYESVGDDSWTFTQLDAATDYVVLAIQIDVNTGTTVGEATYEFFSTSGGGSSDPYAYDEQTNVTVSYTSAEATLEYDDSYQGLYDVVDITITKNDGSDELYLEAVYTTPLVGGVMPDGVYPINATEAEGTFLASSGSDGRYVYPCLYGLLGTSGGYTNAWFLVSGTVTISNNGQNIAVAATNSNGNTINYTFVNGPQAVENVETTAVATKAVKNGQLVIIKNGVEFNAQGAKL